MNTAKAANTIYVMDTSALIEDPTVVLNLDGRVVIPATVIKQLDGLKNNQNGDRAAVARKVSRAIEKAVMQAKAEICHGYDHIDILNSVADNKILGAAIRLGRDKVAKVILKTTDRNMRIAAMSYGIEVDSGTYMHEPVDIPDDYFIRSINEKEGNVNIYDKIVNHVVYGMAAFLCFLLYVIIKLIN